MHNLALDMANQGHRVTGSDDEIFEPSKSRLQSKGLLPETMGWFPEKITTNLDAIILGMHARADNPELVKALAIGVKVYSYPEFIYQQSLNKTRVVVAGSHGKTTITSMILHVLKKLGRDFDYLVGAQIKGFDTMVRLSNAPLIVLEGDEYLASPIDRRPKFHLYHPHIAIISGIAWDHINVFPTWENYKQQFSMFIDSLAPGAKLIYCEKDAELKAMAAAASPNIELFPYGTPQHRISEGKTEIVDGGAVIPISVFGDHNLQNLNGARLVCQQLGISSAEFYHSIADFGGAARRLEEIGRNNQTVVYKDFAHSPSKLMATVGAVKQQWPERVLVACMELHTFSSLTKEFLKEYVGSMDSADVAIVFFKEETIAHKKLEPISADEVKRAFARPDLIVYTKTADIEADLNSRNWHGANLLLMSSGNFGGMNVDEFGRSIVAP